MAVLLGSVDLLGFLAQAYSNLWVYLVLAFVYAILVAIVLPIPIELALVPPLAEQNWAFLLEVSLAIAAGKTVGAWLIFVFGLNVEGPMRKWSERWRLAAWVVRKAERLVAKTGYAGLYLLLSIPLMSDTIPIYVYSLFNAEGTTLKQRMFLIANFLAALNRVAILGAAFFVGKNLFGG